MSIFLLRNRFCDRRFTLILPICGLDNGDHLTLRTQWAALVLWVEYLAGVGAVGELLAEAKRRRWGVLTTKNWKSWPNTLSLGKAFYLLYMAPLTASRCRPRGTA